ncbi:hypothetical protein P6166_07760 [Stenotrophomonas sp. HITSZ_GD]|nr:hypothetical protein [Stenotrophomonas sp. HITSZ_GD]MDG2525246.1 hypothetical protein [Stenotrophomonas sp. HITSZ_GD]
MRELNERDIEMIRGGEMSTRSKVIIGTALVLSPVLGAGMLLGYYSNRQ